MANAAWLAGFAFWVAVVMALFAIWIVKVTSDAARRERHLEERIRRLEDMLAARGLHTRPAQASAPVAQPAPVAPPAAAVSPIPVAPMPKPRPAMSVSQMEEWVGSVWLQNAGSVLVLVGVFFLIQWGYSTGRLGPEALVAAGVAMGLGFLWRGDCVTRTTPAFGHALLGIGVGIVYLSLYVGHVQFGVLPRAVALTLLVLVSIGSILLGLRYRVQTIAMLGVIGAFVPPLLGAWVPLAGFVLGPGTLLAYLAGGLGLFGWTVLKILLVDLRKVDVFWRFLSAVLAGIALLAVSYAYQRKRRLEVTAPAVAAVEPEKAV